MSDIEEEVYYQPEFWGEHPQIPQWEAVEDTLIADTSEVSSIYRVPIQSGFERDLEEGFI